MRLRSAHKRTQTVTAGLISGWSAGDWLRHLLSRPLELQAGLIYARTMTRIQTQLLIVLLYLEAVLSILFTIQISMQTWMYHVYPASIFVIHVLRMSASLGGVPILLRYEMVRVAWITLLVISISSTLMIVSILQHPGLIILELFSMVGPALVMSLWVSAILMGTVIGLTYLVGRSTFVADSSLWAPTVIIFGGVMCVLAGFGFMIRRVIKQFAETTVEIEREAVRRTQAEQKVSDLSHQMRQIALLEHDLRQPLKAVQGNLMSLTVDAIDAEEVIAPALAAAQRAERLVSNLLDQARTDANQYRLARVRTDLHAFFTHLHAALPGLARYYTEPPIPIHLELDPVPMLLLIDPEHFERAVFNLLDNALVYAPNESVIRVRVRQSGNEISIEVQDSGPGIPHQVIAVLMEGNATNATAVRTGFGLQQVKTLVETYAGTLTFTTSSHGTIVRLTFPYDGAVA